MFGECLENVLCILEGKGFKIRLKSEQKKAMRQLYEGKDLLAVHFECERLIKGRNEKYQQVTAGVSLPQPSAPLKILRQ